MNNITTKCAHLSVLHVDFFDLTDNLMVTFVEKHSNMTELYFEYSKLIISDLSILKISECCIDLKVLNLKRLLLITDKSVVKIIQNCANLEVLEVAQCIKLTDVVLSEISQSGYKLHTLNVTGCRRITQKAVDLFQRDYTARGMRVFEYGHNLVS
jgi:hypothetical protein